MCITIYKTFVTAWKHYLKINQSINFEESTYFTRGLQPKVTSQYFYRATRE